MTKNTHGMDLSYFLWFAVKYFALAVAVCRAVKYPVSGILRHDRPPLQERNILRQIKENNSNPCRGCFFVINFRWETILIESFKKSGSKIFFFKKFRKVPMPWTTRLSSTSKHHISLTIEPIHAVGVALCMGHSLLSFCIKSFFLPFLWIPCRKIPRSCRGGLPCRKIPSLSEQNILVPCDTG